jgi:serralysin
VINANWAARAGAALLATISIGAYAVPALAAGTDGAASVSGTKVRFQAGSKVANRVVITRKGNVVTVDDRVKVKAGKGCKAVKGDKTKVRCTVKKGPTRVNVYLYDRSDSVTNNSDLPMSAEGGSGNDQLVGGSRNDILYGMSGADRLYGKGGNDRLDADTGNDLLSTPTSCWAARVSTRSPTSTGPRASRRTPTVPTATTARPASATASAPTSRPSSAAAATTG